MMIFFKQQSSDAGVIFLRHHLAVITVLLFLFFPVAVMCQPDQSSPAKAPVIKEKLKLQEAIELALQQNRTLQKSLLSLHSSSLTLNTLESEFDVKVIPTSVLGYSSSEDKDWVVAATVSKQLSTGIVAAIIPEISSDDDGNYAGVGLSLSVPLLQGLGEKFAKNEIYTGQYNLKKAELGFYQQQDTIVLQVVSAIYQTIKNRQNIEFLQHQLHLLQNHLALAKLKEKAGVISAIDLYRAEIRIKEVQEELTSLQEVYLNSLDEVKEIMAIPITGSLIVEAPVEVKTLDLVEENIIEIALKNRVEMEEGELDLEESRRKMAVAKNGLLPQLNLDVGYNKYSDEELYDLPDESWTVSLSSGTDLFRKSEKNQYEESRISYRRNQIDFEETKELIIKEVRTQLNQLEKQEKQIDIRKNQVNQAKGKLKLSESKFRHGMADNFDLLESQTQLQQAQTNLLSDTISYIIGTYTLRSKIGTLTQRSTPKVSTQ